jgi:hypothetical protein
VIPLLILLDFILKKYSFIELKSSIKEMIAMFSYIMPININEYNKH